MGGKSSTQLERFFFQLCLPIDNVWMFDCSASGIFLSPNYRKFAAECHWNSKISQNVQNLVLFEKIEGFSAKINMLFFKIVKGGKFTVESVSNDFFMKMFFFHLNWGFFAEIRKSLNVDKLSKFSEKYFLWKDAFILLKGLFSKTRGLKICRCWPAVLLDVSNGIYS